MEAVPFTPDKLVQVMDTCGYDFEATEQDVIRATNKCLVDAFTDCSAIRVSRANIREVLADLHKTRVTIVDITDVIMRRFQPAWRVAYDHGVYVFNRPTR